MTGDGNGKLESIPGNGESRASDEDDDAFLSLLLTFQNRPFELYVSGKMKGVNAPIESVSKRASERVPKTEKYQFRTLFRIAGSSSHLMR